MKKEKKLVLSIILALVLVLFIISNVNAGIDVSLTGNLGNPSMYGAYAGVVSSMTEQLSSVWNAGSKLTADAFSIANYQTPLVGEAKISDFTLGLMFSPTLAVKASSISSNMKDTLGAAKGGAMNLGLIFGFSLHKNVDMVIHGIYFPKTKWIKQLEKFEIYGGGVTFRFKLIGEALVAGTGFQGLVLSVSGGYSHMKLSHSQSLNQSANFEYLGAPGVIAFNTFDGTAKLNTYYAGVDLKVYFQILWFLYIYAGAGVIYNHATIKVDSEGYATSIFMGYVNSGSVIISGDDKSNHFIPQIMAGICFNVLGFLKIPFQVSMTWSPKSEKTPIWNLTGGVRFDF